LQLNVTKQRDGAEAQRVLRSMQVLLRSLLLGDQQQVGLDYRGGAELIDTAPE
jgi:hypothetical protein